MVGPPTTSGRTTRRGSRAHRPAGDLDAGRGGGPLRVRLGFRGGIGGGGGAPRHPDIACRVRTADRRPAAGPPARALRAVGPRDGVHLELFAADRVVLLAPGIGVGRPWRSVAGRIARARCYGALARST